MGFFDAFDIIYVGVIVVITIKIFKTVIRANNNNQGNLNVSNKQKNQDRRYSTINSHYSNSTVAGTGANRGNGRTTNTNRVFRNMDQENNNNSNSSNANTMSNVNSNTTGNRNANASSNSSANITSNTYTNSTSRQNNNQNRRTAVSRINSQVDYMETYGQDFDPTKATINECNDHGHDFYGSEKDFYNMEPKRGYILNGVLVEYDKNVCKHCGGVLKPFGRRCPECGVKVRN